MPQPRYHTSAAARQAAYRKRCVNARSAEVTAKGLPALPAISTMPGRIRWSASIEMAQTLMQRTVEEMQEYFDERSEQWQESDRGGEHQNKIDEVQALLDAFDELTI